MVLTDYHIDSVLRTYTRQLLRAKLAPPSDQQVASQPAVRVTISEEARQRLATEQAKSRAAQSVEQERNESVE